MKEEFSTNYRRWYDQDPILSSAMRSLENATDETQIGVALNLIKIIVEHHITDTEFESVEDIVSATEDDLSNYNNTRWYDIDGTLRVSIGLLQNCPEATRATIAKEMAKTVLEAIKKEEDFSDETDVSDDILKELEREEAETPSEL